MLINGAQVIQIHMKGNVVWNFARDNSTGEYLGVCSALNLNVVGDTYSELQEAAAEAMALLFEDLFVTGDLMAFLDAKGWRSATPLPPLGSPPPKFDVPYDYQRVSLAQLTALNA